MKKLITMTIMVLAVAAAMAQAPEKFTYQAVVRNASNSLVANAPVGVRVSILQGSATRSAVYSETHVATTNANGLVTLSIGGGNVQQGAFADIDWANGPFFLKSETDPNGGSNYSITTTQQMLSVPYALYAKEAGNIPTVPTNVSAFTNDAGYLTTAQCGDIDICDLAELVAQLQQQVATLQQQIDSLQGQSGQDTTTNPIDTTTILLPTVFTSTASNITSTSAMVGGNVTSDGGASVTARGVCWSTSQNPTVNDSHTTDGGGMGSFTSNITGLAANTTYYVRAYATNSAGTAYGEEVTFTTLSAGGTAVIDEKSCPEAQTVTDHEGNVYATVQIGNQCWMRDNLRTTTSPSTGTYLIPAAGTGNTYTGKQARWYNNDSATYAPMNYGLLYNWNAAVDTFNTAYGETSVNNDYINAVSVTFSGPRRGICPAGWHLPSDAEWTQLTDYVSSQSEYTCSGNSSNIAKALASTEGWNTYTNNCAVSNDLTANNATGFSAVPAGYCYGSSFYGAGGYANFWSSTQYSSGDAYGRYLGYDFAYVLRDSSSLKDDGYSVRCLRDETGGGGSGSSAVIDEKSCPEAQTVTDHEGNVYATVQIGNQCWMRDNLRTTTSPSTGTYLIPAAGTGNTYTGKQARWYYNDSATYAPMNYGLLYNWNAAVDTFNTAYGETSVNDDYINAVSVTFSGPRRGICPAGWHLPSDAEWTQLTDYVSSQSEYTCSGNSIYIAKALASTEGWWDHSTNNCAVGNTPASNNATGFSAVPAGDSGIFAIFWSSTEYSSSFAYNRYLAYDNAIVDSENYGSYKGGGYSVRCLRD